MSDVNVLVIPTAFTLWSPALLSSISKPRAVTTLRNRPPRKLPLPSPTGLINGTTTGDGFPSSAAASGGSDSAATATAKPNASPVHARALIAPLPLGPCLPDAHRSVRPPTHGRYAAEARPMIGTQTGSAR